MSEIGGPDGPLGCRNKSSKPVARIRAETRLELTKCRKVGTEQSEWYLRLLLSSERAILKGSLPAQDPLEECGRQVSVNAGVLECVEAFQPDPAIASVPAPPCHNASRHGKSLQTVLALHGSYS